MISFLFLTTFSRPLSHQQSRYNGSVFHEPFKSTPFSMCVCVCMCSSFTLCRLHSFTFHIHSALEFIPQQQEKWNTTQGNKPEWYTGLYCVVVVRESFYGIKCNEWKYVWIRKKNSTEPNNSRNNVMWGEHLWMQRKWPNWTKRVMWPCGEGDIAG